MSGETITGFVNYKIHLRTSRLGRPAHLAYLFFFLYPRLLREMYKRAAPLSDTVVTMRGENHKPRDALSSSHSVDPRTRNNNNKKKKAKHKRDSLTSTAGHHGSCGSPLPRWRAGAALRELQPPKASARRRPELALHATRCPSSASVVFLIGRRKPRCVTTASGRCWRRAQRQRTS